MDLLLLFKKMIYFYSLSIDIESETLSEQINSLECIIMRSYSVIRINTIGQKGNVALTAVSEVTS